MPPTNAKWKQLRQEPGYLVSSDGRIWSCKSSLVRALFKNRVGYLSVCIRDKNYSVSRLVADNFIRQVQDDEVVDHINEDKEDNSLSNLRIVSRSKNTNAFYSAKRSHGVMLNKNQKIDDNMAREIIRLNYFKNLGANQLATKFKVSRSAVKNVLYEATHKHIQRPLALSTAQFKVMLSEDAAKEAILLYYYGRSMNQVARQLGCSSATISNIVNQRTYKHLERPYGPNPDWVQKGWQILNKD